MSWGIQRFGHYLLGVWMWIPREGFFVFLSGASGWWRNGFLCVWVVGCHLRVLVWGGLVFSCGVDSVRRYSWSVQGRVMWLSIFVAWYFNLVLLVCM